jgi:Domain of Unknown Function (DUF1080)
MLETFRGCALPRPRFLQDAFLLVCASALAACSSNSARPVAATGTLPGAVTPAGNSEVNVAPALPSASSDSPIVNLFNGVDLSGWTAYRQTQQNSPGTQLTKVEAERIFKPEDGTIHVYGDEANGSTQARHTLITTEAYSKYKFWVEYRWGTKSYAPYADLSRYPRDAGVLFHIHGDRSVVWPSSPEFQIKEGTTGDIYALYARCTSLASNAQSTTFLDAAEGGVPKLVDGANGYVQHSRSANFELPEWNSLELQVDRGAAVYIVNGHVVNRILSVTDRSGGTGAPVTEGPIALQAEHAEVFYRNVRIQILP